MSGLDDLSCNSCSGGSEVDYGSENGDGLQLEVVYPLNEETEVPHTKGNLFKTVLIEGKPNTQPPKGAQVTVHYVGILESDGSSFDSSRTRNEPFTFNLGKGQVIKGWDYGVNTMNIGEKSILKCLPEFGYGTMGAGEKIPPNSTLKFEVELLSWAKNEDVSVRCGAPKAGMIYKSLKVESDDKQSYDHPEIESKVTLSLFSILATKYPSALSQQEGENKHNGTHNGMRNDLSKYEPVNRNDDNGKGLLFEKKDWQCTIGDDVLPVCLEDCLKTMKRRERAQFIISAQFLRSELEKPGNGGQKEMYFARWGDLLLNESHNPSNEPLVYDITLQDYDVVNIWDFKGEEKLTEALRRKEGGNKYFFEKNYSQAAAKYKRALEFLGSTYDLEDKQDEVKRCKTACESNLAQAFMNTNCYPEALTHCDEALKLDSGNLKSMFRRGKVLRLMEDWEEAKSEFKRLLARDPENNEAKTELSAVNAAESAYYTSQKKRFNKLFA